LFLQSINTSIIKSNNNLNGQHPAGIGDESAGGGQTHPPKDEALFRNPHPAKYR
jgi:hypothetical protein